MDASKYNYRYDILTIPLDDTFEDRKYQISGERLVYDVGTYPVSVKLNSTSFDLIPMSPKKQLVAPFHELYFTNLTDRAGEVAQFIVFSPSDITTIDADVNVDTITSIGSIDSVNTILQDDSDYYHDVNGNGFRSANLISAVGGEYGQFHIINPDESGKILIIRSIKVSPRSYNVQINIHSAVIAGLSAVTLEQSSLIGESMGVAELYQGTDPAIAGTKKEGFNFWNIGAVFDLIQKDSAIVIPENQGILIAESAVANTLSYQINWIEKDA